MEAAPPQTFRGKDSVKVAAHRADLPHWFAVRVPE
jgi:hypothetical protein